jgi:hypothetical protein
MQSVSSCCGLPIRSALLRGVVPSRFHIVARKIRSTMLIVFLSAVPAGSAAATDYYLSADGSDANSGVSESSPWKTLWRINQVSLSGGDRVLLRGGDTFPGGLVFNMNDEGRADKQITVTSYGTGRAIISAGTGGGIYAYNTAGFTISRLRLLGSSAETNNASGIYFYTDLPDTKLDTILIERVDVAGFKNGIEIGAWNGTAGFKNVIIRKCTARDNRENGITVWGYDAAGHTGYSHKNVYVGYCRASGNSGPTSVGNGIVVSNIDGGVIERSVAHHNGMKNKTGRGPVGIWAWRANNIVIQHNESYSNCGNTGGDDGNGFNLDGGMTNSILQYNYSHDNHGGGFVFAQYAGALPFTNNIIRYNISENDGRRNYFSGIFVWSADEFGIQKSQIYSNTVYITPAQGTVPSGIAVVSKTKNVAIWNNIIVTTGGLPLLAAVSGQIGMNIQGNAYWSSGAPFRIKWDGKEYGSLMSFRSAGQERIGRKSVGLNVDPQLSDPGKGIRLGKAVELESLSGYKLKSTSPLVGKGLDLRSRFGISVGKRDYFGSKVPINRNFEIGAHEMPDHESVEAADDRARHSSTIDGG